MNPRSRLFCATMAFIAVYVILGAVSIVLTSTGAAAAIVGIAIACQALMLIVIFRCVRRLYD